MNPRTMSIVTLAALLVGCGGSGGDDSATDEAGTTPFATDPAATDGGENDDAAPPIADAGHDAAKAPTDGGKSSDAGVDGSADAGPSCSKHLTVVFAVGTGAGAVTTLTNGCWDVVDADGAANNSFRKCSTSNFVIGNPTAPNYAYDDMNPTRALSTDQNYLAQCSSGATGDGYEYLAYRGGWRLIGAPHLRAYFAELYGDSVDDVDSLESQSGVYHNNAQLAAHAPNVYPMINIGPNKSANLQGTIQSATLKLCKPIQDGGYFGTYVATYQAGMTATDPRAIAFATAMNDCTKK